MLNGSKIIVATLLLNVRSIVSSLKDLSKLYRAPSGSKQCSFTACLRRKSPGSSRIGQQQQWWWGVEKLTSPWTCNKRSLEERNRRPRRVRPVATNPYPELRRYEKLFREVVISPLLLLDVTLNGTKWKVLKYDGCNTKVRSKILLRGISAKIKLIQRDNWKLVVQGLEALQLQERFFLKEKLSLAIIITAPTSWSLRANLPLFAECLGAFRNGPLSMRRLPEYKFRTKGFPVLCRAQDRVSQSATWLFRNLGASWNRTENLR